VKLVRIKAFSKGYKRLTYYFLFFIMTTLFPERAKSALKRNKIGGEMMKRNACRRIVSLALSLVLSTSLIATVSADYEMTYSLTKRQAEDNVNVGLTQLGYTENSKNYSKYGEWYASLLESQGEDGSGFSTGAWCAMFTSWCAEQAGISQSIIARYALCQTGVEFFKEKGAWNSRSSGYTPQAGDIIFFDWDGGGWSDHTGLVLFAENGKVYTLEGNTSANRLDGATVTATGTELDRVMVRVRDLSNSCIMGYGSPKYTSGDASDVEYEGVVDLEQGTMKDNCLDALNDGIMDLMSSHTFGPYYGMTRAEYVDFLYRIFQPTANTSGTSQFSDVSKSNEYYNEILAFKALGLTSGVDGTKFDPDTYITASAAISMLKKVCNKFGAEVPSYTPTGNAKYGYLQRYEAAKLYTALGEELKSDSQVETIKVTNTSGKTSEIDAIQISDGSYIQLSDWQTVLNGTNRQFSKYSEAEKSSTEGKAYAGKYTLGSGSEMTAFCATYRNRLWYSLEGLAENSDMQLTEYSDGVYILIEDSAPDLGAVRPVDFHDYSNTLADSALYSSYTVSATASEDNKSVNVVIKAADVRSFTNGNGQKGYWTGFALIAPSGAVKAEYSMTGSKNNLTSCEITDKIDGIQAGIALYYDLKSASGSDNLVYVQWKNSEGKVINAETYQVDLTSSNVISESSYVGDFTDVKLTAWYSSAVQYVKDNGIMSGTSNSTFSPQQKVSRAMVAQVIYAMEGKPDASGGVEFSDVSSSKWYYDAIRWTASMNIVSGYGNNMYGPEDNVTREQMVAILKKYAAFKNADTSNGSDLSSFADQSSISKWATESVSWAVAAGLLSGRTDGTLDPKGTATRCEVAQILTNFHKQYIA